MTGTLSAFLAQNAKKVDNAFFAVSKRFVDENGEAMKWEFCCISAKENKDIRNNCMKTVPIPGKKGQHEQFFDAAAYQLKITARCTVFPELNNEELQNSYGCKDAEELLSAMLLPGEYEEYSAKVLALNGFDDMGELVDEAKN